MEMGTEFLFLSLAPFFFYYEGFILDDVTLAIGNRTGPVSIFFGLGNKTFKVTDQTQKGAKMPRTAREKREEE